MKPKARRTSSAMSAGAEKTRAALLGYLAGAAAGSIPVAAELAGIHSWTVYRWAKKDEAFAAQVAEAKALGDQVALTLLEREADRRAMEGVEEPVYQKGELVGHIRRYSDNLLMFRTKKLDPSYRDRPPDTFVAGNVQVVVSSFAASLPSASPALPHAASTALEEGNP